MVYQKVSQAQPGCPDAIWGWLATVLLVFTTPQLIAIFLLDAMTLQVFSICAAAWAIGVFITFLVLIWKSLDLNGEAPRSIIMVVNKIGVFLVIGAYFWPLLVLYQYVLPPNPSQRRL